jgi:hypothetical protein
VHVKLKRYRLGVHDVQEEFVAPKQYEQLESHGRHLEVVESG